MKQTLRALLVLSAVLSLLWQPFPSSAQTSTQKPPITKQKETELEQGDVVRINTRLVNSPVLVTGRDGRMVPNLKQADFRIFEDGKEQRIAYFAPVDTPLTLALLLDTSRSNLFQIRDLRDAALSIVDNLRSGDRALVVTFSDDIKVLAEATSDRELLWRAVGSLRPGGNTRIYDAVDFVLTEKLRQVAGRKALILLTDGVDNASGEGSYQSNLRNALRTETLIYPVQFSTFGNIKETKLQREPFPGSGFNVADYKLADAYLHQLAVQSGTTVHQASDLSDLDKTVAGIIEELHNEYTLGYYAQLGDDLERFRRVEVRVSQEQLTVRARNGYYPGIVPERRSAGSQGQTTLVSSTSSVGAEKLAPRESKPLGARWLCKGTTVPGDFAVVAEGYDAKCSPGPSEEANAWYIRKPGRNEIVCKGFASEDKTAKPAALIPSGYAVTGEVISQTCASSHNPASPMNAWTIKLPTGRETVCKGFAIPRGFVVIGEKKSGACPTRLFWKNAWVIAPKARVENRSFWPEP